MCVYALHSIMDDSDCLTSHFCYSPGGVIGGSTTMGAWLHGVKETSVNLFNSIE